MKLFSLHSFNRPVRILFVCLGNICRSPMAEFVMKDLVRKAGLSDRFEIASAATSREELGNPVYPPARRELQRHGIACEGHAARQMTRADYAHYDLLLGMDDGNLRDMRRRPGGQAAAPARPDRPPRQRRRPVVYRRFCRHLARRVRGL